MSIFLVVLGITVVIGLVAGLDRLGTRGKRPPPANQSDPGDSTAMIVPLLMMSGDSGSGHQADDAAPADGGFGGHGGGSDFTADSSGGDFGGDAGGGDGGGGGD